MVGIMFYVQNEGFYGAGIRGRPPGSRKGGENLKRDFLIFLELLFHNCWIHTQNIFEKNSEKPRLDPDMLLLFLIICPQELVLLCSNNVGTSNF